ncbi:nitroreductase [Methanocella sp. CWC-04]|uniref:Nitroreductase n=1 Tax=Methanooceanicella nereidis TaxID=2052831 RepID=A0AAP2RAU4_9EURY|nr:nitroreductase family protein [Methanocella sp. CWC-04]MCD1293918.1 nitroreductase [Methanocella sp. CWC-04]
MDVSEAIETRRAIRSFKKERPSKEQIKRILHAGHMAPSAGNLQGRDFIIIEEDSIKRSLSIAALGQTFIMEAPVCIVSCANTPRSASKYGSRAAMYAIQDASIAVMNMMLMARDLGLGTCWVGAFDENKVAEILGLPDGVRPVAIVPLGYPDEKPEAPPRLGDRIEHWNGW